MKEKSLYNKLKKNFFKKSKQLPLLNKKIIIKNPSKLPKKNKLTTISTIFITKIDMINIFKY